MSDLAQRLRDRIDISKWHDAGLINSFEPTVPHSRLMWPTLTDLIREAADAIEQLTSERWPSSGNDAAASESRRLLLVACQNAGVNCTGKWLSESARDAIEQLTAQRDAADAECERLREQLNEIHESWGMKIEH